MNVIVMGCCCYCRCWWCFCCCCDFNFHITIYNSISPNKWCFWCSELRINIYCLFTICKLRVYICHRSEAVHSFWKYFDVTHFQECRFTTEKNRQATTVKNDGNKFRSFWLFCLHSSRDWSLKRAIKAMTKIDDDNSVHSTHKQNIKISRIKK